MIFLTPRVQEELTYVRFPQPSFERDRNLDTADYVHDIMCMANPVSLVQGRIQGVTSTFA